MDTISASADGSLRVAAATAIGARHQRGVRNGQDAAALWTGADRAAIVVCDGCSAGASSEVGARLGALLVVRALAARLASGVRPSSPALWHAVRADVLRGLAIVLEQIAGDRARAIREHFLFTIVAAAAAPDDAAVWLVGDGAYAFDGDTHVRGPFADNQPPYLAYDLLGAPCEEELALAPAGCRAIVIATDGVVEHGELASFAAPRFVEHPDALRRRLALLSAAEERVDWEARRIARIPAVLQDDCAIAVLRREVAP